MDYIEALEYINEKYTFAKEPSLQRISDLLKYLGNPQDKLKYIHVAGTNGKGSTVSFINNILIKAGYKVGMYTSPYITRFTERIKINNVEIETDELANITSQLKIKVDEMRENGEVVPTTFDIITAIAFKYYYDKQCDIVVLETGIGGTYDSTNIIKENEVAVITSIGFDHTEILGNTLQEICKNKAGIIKTGSNVVVYPQDKEILNVFYEEAQDKKCDFYYVDKANIKIVDTDNIRVNGINNLSNNIFSYKDIKEIEILLLGKHQIINACVAIETTLVLKKMGYNISYKNIKEGLLKTVWAGRLEVINKTPLFIVDGAHNEQGAKVLADSIKQYFKNKNVIFICGILENKDYKAMLKYIIPIAYKFITVTPSNFKAIDGEDLFNYIRGYHSNVDYAKDIKAAINISMQNKEDIICAFGSLYLISEIRNYFLK